MIEIDIPGTGVCRLEHLVLDLNGTVACDGAVLDGVVTSVKALSTLLDITLLTADTHGTANAVSDSLGATLHVLEQGGEADQKLALVQRLGARSVVAVGNGANDAKMLQAARIGIAVIQGEGAATSAVAAADVVCLSISDALGMLARPSRLLATLRV